MQTRLNPPHVLGLCYTSVAPCWELFKVLMHICCSCSVWPRGSWPPQPLFSDGALCEGLTSDLGVSRCPPNKNTPAAALQKGKRCQAILLSSRETRSHLCVGVVGVPRGSQGLLASDVPHQEVGVLHHYFFHVASNGGWRMDDLVHQTLDTNINEDFELQCISAASSCTHNW